MRYLLLVRLFAEEASRLDRKHVSLVAWQCKTSILLRKSGCCTVRLSGVVIIRNTYTQKNEAALLLARNSTWHLQLLN